MATINTNNIEKLYLAYFGRPADPAGLLYWEHQLPTTTLATQAQLTQMAASFSASAEFIDQIHGQTFTEIVNNLYLNLFGRNGETAGLLYWADELATGKQTFNTLAVQMMFSASGPDKTAMDSRGVAAHTFTAALDTPADILGYSGPDSFAIAHNWLAPVNNPATAQAATAPAVLNEAVAQATSPGEVSTGLFTLTDGVVTPAQTAQVLMWGYTPDDQNVSQGIPAVELLIFLRDIAGLDLIKLGLIDSNGVEVPGAIKNITISNITGGNTGGLTTGAVGDTTGGNVTGDIGDGTSGGTGADAEGGSNNSGKSIVTITTGDGQVISAEASLGHDYLTFLNNLIFDSNGDSRLYMADVVTHEAIYPADSVVLTTTQNNGRTFETGFTTSGDETIVAGRTELLHQAYINAGAGYDTLEVDMKGVYAQPLQLLNIEQINVQNLPNVYTTGENVPGGNTYPDLSSGTDITNSFLDLSRATSLKKLVITEGGATDFGGLGGAVDLGTLSIVGIRNAATVRLEGGFTEDVNLSFGQGQTGAVNVELLLGDTAGFHLNVAHNTPVLNIDSQGYENYLQGVNFFNGNGDDNLAKVNITGEGALFIEDALDGFRQNRTATIDAHSNTGGVQLTFEDQSHVKFLGSQGDDNFTSTGSTLVNITGGIGNNVFKTDGSETVNITSGNGNDTISSVDSDMVTIDAGNGKNNVTVSAKEINITTGTGNDKLVLAGTGGEGGEGGVGAGVNLMLILDDSGSMSGQNVADLQSAANAMLDQLEASSIDATSITVVFGSSATAYPAGTWGTIGEARTVINSLSGSSGGTDYLAALAAAKTAFTNPGAFADGHNVIAFISDGYPNELLTAQDEADWTGFLTTNKIESYAIGIGTLTDTTPLEPIAYDGITGTDKPAIFAADLDQVLSDLVEDIIASVGNEAVVTLDLGTGKDTIILGDSADLGQGLTALEGSSINGSNISVFVENDSDLSRADELNGIAKVTLKGDLTLTADQFSDIGSAAFNVYRASFGETADLHIIVNQDVILEDLVNLSQLSTNVRLNFDLKNGAELTLTAEQLQKYVAHDGIDSTDGLNGKVTILNAGQNFDPFDNGDDYQVIDGGSLTDNFDASTDVTIIRTVNGYERPAPAASTDVLTIDSTVTPVVTTAIISEVATLKIIGNQDVTFTSPVDLGRDAIDATHPALADGRAPDWAAPESDNFTINFSALTGKVVDLTVANFQDVKQIMGNGNATRDVRLDVELTDGSTVGAPGDGHGLKSTGVQTYVVTAIGDDSVGEDANASSATFYVCDLSKDVKVLGLQGNYNDTINFKQVNWGTNFLLEAGGADKADGNPSYANIGNLHAEYFWQGAGPQANAVVNINNQGVALTRPINVAGIVIDYADSITMNVTDGDLIVNAISGSSLNALTVVSAGDVQLGIGADLLDGKIGNSGATITSVLNGTAVVGDFVLNMSGDNDFSKATLSGIDALNIVDNAIAGTQAIVLTLSADQVVTLGPVIADKTSVDTSTLNVNGLSTQALDLSTIDVDAIGTVTFTDTGTSIVVDPATNFGGASSVVILAQTSDTSVEMTAAQFETISGTSGTGTNSGAPIVNVTEEGSYNASLVLTDLANDVTLNLANVAQGADVVINVDGVVATDKFVIADDATPVASLTLDVSGTNDLTKANLSAAGIDKVIFSANATLTLTAAQFATLPAFTDANNDGAADNWTVAAGATVKLNIIDVENGFALDLNKLQGSGIDIGTLTLKNSDAAIVFAPVATLGDADSIITPTKGGLAAGEPVEKTTLSLTAQQFNELAGTGTITGDSTVFITELKNNTDVNGDNVLNAKDVVTIDVTGVTAPKGTVTLADNSVTLAPTSSLAGFEIRLGNGQMIRFNTTAQASGATITEVAPGTDVTAVVWLFTSVAAPVDTSKYNATINHLFILNTLVDGSVEESLWTTLAQSIVVQKFSDALIPDVLTGFARVNTFEALTSVPDGINYDNKTLLESTTILTMNLEGNTTIGDVTVGDTNVPTSGTPVTGLFESMTINSYEDRSSLAARGLENNAYVFQPNKVGNISLNPGSTDNLVNVTLNTYDNVDNIIGTADDAKGFLDVVNVNAVVAERDGLALDVGIITFAATATVANPTTPATLTLTGAKNITIAGVDITDTEVNLLTINASAFTGDLVIGGIVPTGGSAASNALGSFDHIYVVDGYIAPAAAFGVTGNNLLVVAGNANDFTAATSFDVDKVTFTANSTLTLTAAQVAAIGTVDGTDVGTAADQWSTLAGLNVTLNITELDGTDFSPNMLLDQVAAAGINIGTITIKDTNGIVTIDPGMNMGAADSIIVPEGTTLNLTAAQFEQLDGIGTITGQGTGVTQGKVNITDLTGAQAAIDLSAVTAQNGTITLSHTAQDSTPLTPDNDHLGGTDVTLTAAAKLGHFSITLDDINSDAAIDNELAGQTIRFSTAAQAERAIVVTGADNNAGGAWTPGSSEYYERDTNVVWLFNTISGTATADKINTHDYDAALGRVWVNDALVNGKNVEDIFSSPSAVQANPTTGLVNLNSTTIIRVVDTASLATLPPDNLGVSRTVEVESFTKLPGGLIFSNPDKLVGVQNLTFDLGGDVAIGNISIDDIVAPVISNNNHFGTLTINSLLADSPTHYLLPENWVAGTNPLPTGPNVLGNISSGATRDELANVKINATGVGLNTGTITFVETTNIVTNPTPQNTLATLTVTGNKNVNIQSVNTADVDITALTVDTTGYTGVLTAPGASPAFALNNTQTLTFKNDGGAPEFPLRDPDGTGPLPDPDGSDGIITLGTATNAGVAGNELSFINSFGYDGDLNLGILAQLDSTNDDNNGDGDTIDPGDAAFTLTSGQGITTATLAAANGLVPTLNAGSEWKFDYTGAAAGSYLKITPTAVFQTGSILRLNNVPVVIEGAVNLSNLVDNTATATVIEGLIMTGGKINVQAGATLTLTAGQVNVLNLAGVDIVGEGTIKVTGDASNLALGSNLKTAIVDISGVTLIASPAAGFDVDDTVNLTGLTGATVTVAGITTMGLAQTVIGSPNADAITTTSIKNDIITGGAGNDAINAGAGNNTINVDAGTDTITGLNTGDVLVVSSGATAIAGVAAGFTATAATVNNGTTNLTNSGIGNDSTFNMSLATGSNGFNLTGGASNVAGVDVLIGSSKVDTLNGGNTNQAAGSNDTLTGNAGADVFQFNVGTSTPVALTDTTVTPNIDRELVQVFAPAAASGNLSIDYTVNGVASASPLLVAVAAGDGVNAVAAKVAAAFAGLPGYTALSITDTASIAPPSGSGLEINNVNPDATGVAAGWGNGTDVAQLDRVNVGTAAVNTVTPGEKYTIDIALAGNATTISNTYTAVDGDTTFDVALGLGLAINNSTTAVQAVDLTVNAAGVWGIDIQDQNPDDGGFTATTSAKGGFAGSGASDAGATAINTADLITDFLSGTDDIDLNLIAGTTTNYAEASEVATYALAFSAADTALNGVVQYYLTSVPDNTATLGVTDPTGLLFFDANTDGTVDGVIALTGISSADFAYTDIIA